MLPAFVSVADVAVSSSGNFLVNVAAARSLGLSEFGTFSAGMLAGLITVGAVRSGHGDPLVLDFSAKSAEQRTAAAKVALGSATLITLAVSMIAAAAMLLLLAMSLVDMERILPWLALVLALPALIVQDFYRSLAYASASPNKALSNSVAWTVLLTVAVVALGLSGRGNAAAYLAIWSGSALAGAVVGWLGSNMSPSFGSAVLWYRHHRQTIRRVVMDFGLIQATTTAALLLVGLLAGAADLGLIRKAQIPLAPLTLLSTVVVTYFQPVLVRRASREGPPRETKVAGLQVAIAAGAVAAAWTLLVWLAPPSVWEAMVGTDWRGPRGLVPLVGAYLSLGAAAAAIGITLRALGGLREQLRLRVVLAPLTIGLVAVGALTKGATGASSSLVLSGAVGLSLSILLLRNCRPHHSGGPVA